MPYPTLQSPRTPSGPLWGPEMPDIKTSQPFVDLVRSLAAYVVDVVDAPHTFEQLRDDVTILRPLVGYLSEECYHREIISALLVLKWHYKNLGPDDRGLNESRGYACEIVAWRFLVHLSERDVLDYLLYQLPDTKAKPDQAEAEPASHSEETPLLQSEMTSARPGLENQRGRAPAVEGTPEGSDDQEEDPTVPFIGRNALEIAAIADAKNFLSHRTVQNLINAIWVGDIIFWDSLSLKTERKAQKYNKRKTDPYTRLRIPLYNKVFEGLFFVAFLVIYYVVLLERNPNRVTPAEVLLFIWIASFAYEELGEYQDAGTLFYTADIWNLTNICILLIAVAFLIARIIGLVQEDSRTTDIAFDILSLEALFLVPRLCSLLSVNHYFGVLLPCLKEMTKDFIKFLGLVLIIYLGFLTTFSMLARDVFTFKQISWYLVYVFFGSSYMGFDIASTISPALGPPLMIIFVCLTNILLITSLISLLSNTLTKVMANAREEYLFQYSVFVLEASASQRLTYFFPPLNLLPLIFLRPLRLFASSETVRGARITLLKATHLQHIAAIWLYESGVKAWGPDRGASWHHTRESRPRTPLHARFSSEIQALGNKQNRSRISLLEAQRRSSGADGAEEAPNFKGLENAVATLISRVEELSWRLDQQRGEWEGEGQEQGSAREGEVRPAGRREGAERRH